MAAKDLPAPTPKGSVRRGAEGVYEEGAQLAPIRVRRIVPRTEEMLKVLDDELRAIPD